MSEDNSVCNHVIDSDPCNINNTVGKMSNTSVDKQEQPDQKSVTDEEYAANQEVFDKSEALVSKLCDEFSLDDLEKRCEQLFMNSDESRNKLNAMDIVERLTYFRLRASLEKHFALKRGLAIVKNMYKVYLLNQELHEEDAGLINKMCEIIFSMSQKKSNRVTVLEMNEYVACDTDQLSIFRRGRHHPKRPCYPIESILGNFIPIEVVKDLVYVDQDKDNQFTGFIYMNIGYFKKCYKELKYTTLEEWSDAVPDGYLRGIYPVDACPEEFRNVGIKIDFGLGAKYNTICINSYLINVNKDQALDENQYLKFYDGHGVAESFSTLA
jgi:hypothetical protein